jgi:hypothetical protein
MEREIEKPKEMVEGVIVEKNEAREKDIIIEKEVKEENPEEKKRAIEEAFEVIKKQENTSNVSDIYNQDAIVSRLIKIAIAEGPEAIKDELSKISDPYILDRVHDELMKTLNK